MNHGSDLAPYLNHTYAEIEPDSWMEDLLISGLCPLSSYWQDD